VLKRLRSKLTYANVMATIAIFFVLTGIGFAVAKLPKKSVGTKQLKNNAVTSKKIHKNAVNASKIKTGAVGRSEIASGAVSTSEISNQAVTRSKIADSAIPLLGTLRTGQTLRGSFDLGSAPGGAGNTSHQGYSFQFPLNNAPTAPAANVLDLVANPGANTASCPGVAGGNVQTPNAANGQLCVYITGKTNLAAATPVQIENTSRLGFGLVASSGAAATDYVATGFWAVTAP
jgi:hypothetical protein